MARRTSDSIIVITGASSGIGRATALMAAERGATVVLAARQKDVLEEVAQECDARGGRSLPVQTDVTDAEQMEKLARGTVETFGRIDAWVNNAGVALYSRFEETSPEAFRQVIETNLFGCVNGAKAVLPYFRKQGHGVLINLSSAFGKVGGPYVSAYSTSKFAITGFSESLRMELREEADIHVCTILPATIDTPIFHHAANYTGRALQALPPIYEPEEVANAILDCIKNPKREVLVGGAAKEIAMLGKLSRPLTERFMAIKVEKQHFQKKPSPPSDGNLFAPMPGINRIKGGWKERERKGKKGIVATAALVLGGGIAAYLFYRKRQKPLLEIWKKRVAPLRHA